MMMWRGGGAHSEWQKEQVVSAVVTTTSVELQYIRVLSTIWKSFSDG
jgi:hypothetical protein